ncbi:Transcription factor spt8 [Knufia obscura]|uniref:Transcription factor spt8 n=2 Tax=Knufia TaxID=430999 RepID=A0AAN8I638_9EURO|nr:Transcription factor spt8 [Knufia obscura]KAK5953974.1 Transcription factor spt8 [Knufia fluminis]
MDDDYERSIGSPDAASQDGGSDNDMDETMRDADAEDDDRQEEEMDDADDDGDGDNEDDTGNQSDDNTDQQQGATTDINEQTQAPYTDTTKAIDLSHPRPEVLTASTYDIVPTIAAPQSTSINAVCGTADSRWIFTGGADGYIRQYNWVESVNGKTQLTVAQRHPFVDSVVKAGVLVTYWENYDARKQTPGSSTLTTSQNLTPVYALACHSQALWMAAGTSSGAVRLQTVRHDEGHQIALLQKHTSAISVLSLASDEKSLLSGSWDKTVVDWDLNTGQVRTSFAPSGAQISCIESRPISTVPVPYESGEPVKTTTTMSSNNAAESVNGALNGAQSPNTAGQDGAATPDSLFGGDDGDDDLFGDNADAGLSNGNAFGFDESEMNQTVEDAPAPEDGTATNLEPTSEAPAVQPPGSPPKVNTSAPDLATINGVPNTAQQPLTNGLPHAEDVEKKEPTQDHSKLEDQPITSDSTFMATSFDGSIRVWDRRQPLPVARITPYDTPPWCLSACWSPDGNNIYAGRRNNTVEEYDLRKGLRQPDRVFRFPQGSGAVTSVKAMPNGRHLVCASYDILRLYDLKHSQMNKSGVPFLIVPGHRTGTISNLYLSADCRYMLSTGGNRGWEGSPTEVLLGYEIGVPKSA